MDNNQDNDNREISFGAIRRDSVSTKVIDQILKLISEKQLRPGDRLPPERKLAEILHVSRPSLREALHALAIMKILENRQGAGTYITSLKPEIIIEHLETIFVLDDSTYLQLLQARKVVETGIVEMAAEKITDADLERLQECLDREQQVIDDPEQFLKLDIEFHRIISESAQNSLLNNFMNSIIRLGIHSRRRTGEKLEVRERTVADHRLIMQALKNRDPEHARLEMLNHLGYIEKGLKHTLDDENPGPQE